jgi:phage/plasmid-associated DNA primase
LICDCNYLPISSDSTIFQSERTEVLPFNRHFEPHEQDKELKIKLTKEKELTGILNWALKGWLSYRKDGLARTKAIEDASRDYEESNDKISNFLNDCLVKASGCCVSVKQAYQLYEEWCEDCGFGVDNKSNFIADCKAKKIYKPTGTINGKTVRNVIVGYDVLMDFEDASESPDIPFIN